MFAGTHTALVTPFKNGAFDEDCFRKLIDNQFDAGISGIVPVGTTGESPTLDYEEHKRVIEVAVEQAKGRGLVIAGTGSNSTREAVAMTQFAEEAGADASLQVCPYYNKPSQEGLFQHYKAVADSTKLPLVLYSIPGRCGIAIEVDTCVRLGEACGNIRAVKEAGGSVERVSQLVDALPPDFEVLSGDDSLTLPFMSVGASGVVSVASNIIPGPMVNLVKSMLANDLAAAREIHSRYYKLFSAFLKLDTNPIPIKTALYLRGDIGPEMRRPLVGMPDDSVAVLKATLAELGVI